MARVDLTVRGGGIFGLACAWEAARRGAKVVALDYAEQEVTSTRATFAAMYEAGELKAESFTGVEKIVIENPGINYTSAPTINIRGDGIGASAKASIVNGKIEWMKS